MKTSYKIPIIVIPAVLIFSFFVISYDTGLGDTPYDIEVQFDAEEYSVNYFVVNGNTDNIEIDIPLDMIDSVFMIYVNDQVVDDERVILDGNKIIVNYGQNIESVKLMGSHDLSGAEPEEQVWSGAEGMCAEGYPDCEDYVGSIVEPGFKNEEPFTKIEIMFGEPLNDKLVPVIFTEVTTHAETLDEIMVWNFELIGHSGDDRRVVWDTLPKDKRIWYVINDDGQDIRIPANIVVPADQHIYEMDCGLFQTVEGESAHPTLILIKNNTSTIYAQNSRIGIYPDSNEEYSFEFASIFKNYVSFPEDAVEIISQDTRECKLTQNVENDLTGKYTDGYYTKMTFRFN